MSLANTHMKQQNGKISFRKFQNTFLKIKSMCKFKINKSSNIFEYESFNNSSKTPENISLKIKIIFEIHVKMQYKNYQYKNTKFKKFKII